MAKRSHESAPRGFNKAFQSRRLGAACGVEVTGIDLREPLSNDVFDALRQTWLDGDGVMVIRDQHLDPETHLAFSRRFGPLFGEAEHLQDTVKRYLHPNHPGIYRVSNKKDGDGEPLGRKRAGTYWHSDVSFRTRPAEASILYGIEVPAFGGDTLFASMYQAYDALSQGLKRMLEPLNAVHDFAVQAPESYDTNVVVRSDFDGQNRALHPVIITHPETHRRALFVNPGFTAGVHQFDPGESDCLLSYLYRHSASWPFIYRHPWQPKDLVIWDNRCVMHYAIADYDEERYLHRTTVIADPPRR